MLVETRLFTDQLARRFGSSLDPSLLARCFCCHFHNNMVCSDFGCADDIDDSLFTNDYQTHDDPRSWRWLVLYLVAGRLQRCHGGEITGEHLINIIMTNMSLPSSWLSWSSWSSSRKSSSSSYLHAQKDIHICTEKDTKNHFSPFTNSHLRM